jgi:hypothetical protein
MRGLLLATVLASSVPALPRSRLGLLGPLLSLAGVQAVGRRVAAKS